MKRLKGEGKAASSSITFKHDPRYNASGNPTSKPKQAHPDADERRKQKQPARPVTNMGLSAPLPKAPRKSYISG